MLKLFKKLHFKYLLWLAKREDPTFEWTEENEEMARDIENGFFDDFKDFLDPDFGKRDLDVGDSFEIPSEVKNEA